MQCLIKKYYKKELSEYGKILGSEEAAYYVLAMNNGHPLNENPDGSTSSLYTKLLEETGSHEQAILNMAIVFTPKYMEQHGDWTDGFKASEGSVPPSFTTLQGTIPGFGSFDSPATINDFLSNEQIERVHLLEQLNEIERRPLIQQAIQADMDNYVQNKVDAFVSEHPDATEFEISVVEANAKKEFNKTMLLDSVDILLDYLQKHGFDKTKEGKDFISSLQHNRLSDSTVFERKSKNILVLLDLVQRVLTDEDLSVVPTEFAQLYIRTYFNTNLVQNAIEEMQNVTGFNSTEQLIQALAKTITNRTTNKTSFKFKEAVSHYWHKFKNLLRKLFRKELVDYKRRNEVLDLVTAAFAANQNLEEVDDEKLKRSLEKLGISYDSHRANPDTVIAKIKKGLESRIESLRASTNLTEGEKKETLLNLQDLLDKINELSTFSAEVKEDESIKLITQFVESGLIEIANTMDKLKDIGDRIKEERQMYIYKRQKKEYTRFKYDDSTPFKITLEELLKLKTDIVGFYATIIESELSGLLAYSDRPELASSGVLKENIDLIIKQSALLQGNINTKIEQYAEIIVERCANEYVDVGDRERFKVNALKWLKNKINKGDLAWIEKLLGSGISSQSPIVRMADFLIREVNQEIHQKSVQKGKELLRLYTDAIPFLARFSPSNFARLFYEMDEDGKPTGNLVSAVNEGLAERKRQKLIESLNKSYKIKDFDQDGKPIFDSDEQWKNYMDDYDIGLEKLHIHRRYTADYYLTQRRCLSRSTLELINNINKEIQKIYDRCFDKELGIPITADLKPKYKRQLADLLEYKQQLSNPYIIKRDDSGKIISITKKTGPAAKIAEELNNWNAEKSGMINYKNDKEKFDIAYQKVKDRYGEDSDEAKLFYREHVYVTLSEDYYETIRNAFISTKNEESTQLLARKRAILNSVKAQRGYYMPNLDLLSDEAWKELKRIDKRLSEIRTKSKPTSKTAADAFSERVAKYQVKKPGTDIPYIKWLEDNVSADELEERYYYEDKDGNKHPLSIFTYSGPVNARDIVGGLTSPFSQIDEDSYFVDEKYNASKQKSLQADADYYHNDTYDRITDKNNKYYNAKIHKLYDFIYQMNKEAWEMLPDLYHGEFQLPQRRDRNGQLITKLQGQYENIKAISSNLFKVNENDIEYNEEFITRPDGSVVNSIPIRWVKKLDDPSTISTDIVQLMTAFYEMALNYKKKAEIMPELELLQAELDVTSNIEPSDQAQRMRKHLEMYLYGRTRTGFRKNRRMGTAEQAASKIAHSLNQQGHSKLMPKNILSILKNWNDSLFSLVAEMVGGRHFTISSFKRAVKYMGAEFKTGHTIFTAAGRVTMHSWTAQCLLSIGVHGSINDIFGKHNETWLRRFIENFFSMGEYTFIDYIFKGLITNMIYASRRLIVNPVTGQQEFMTRQRAEWLWSQEFGDKKAGRRQWEQAKLTLHDAYEVDKQGNFVIKPEYKDIIHPIKTDGNESYKLETQVATTIKERCSVINGMLDEMDKNGMSQNYLGAMFLLMRGWMVTQFVDYSKTGHDFAVYYEEGDSVSKSMNWFKKQYAAYVDTSTGRIFEEDPNFSGQYNFGTGIIEKGWWQGLLGAYWRYFRGLGILRAFMKDGYADMTDHQIYQIRRNEMCLLAFLACFAMGWAAKIWIESMFNGGGDGGDDDERDLFEMIEDEDYKAMLQKFKVWSAYLLQSLSAATASERLSQLGPLGFGLNIVELVQTLFISSSYIKDLKYIVIAGGDTIELLARLMGLKETPEKDDDPLRQEVKRGVYTGYPQWVKDYSQAASELPGINQFGVTNIVKRGTVRGLKQAGGFYTGTLNQFMIPFPVARTSKTQKTNLFDYWDALSADENIKPTKKKSSQPEGFSGKIGGSDKGMSQL